MAIVIGQRKSDCTLLLHIAIRNCKIKCIQSKQNWRWLKNSYGWRVGGKWKVSPSREAMSVWEKQASANISGIWFTVRAWNLFYSLGGWWLRQSCFHWHGEQREADGLCNEPWYVGIMDHDVILSKQMQGRDYTGPYQVRTVRKLTMRGGLPGTRRPGFSTWLLSGIWGIYQSVNQSSLVQI